MLCGQHLLKQKVVVVQICVVSGNSRQIIARNATFEGRLFRAKFLSNLGPKCQKTDYFQEYHFSQS